MNLRRVYAIMLRHIYAYTSSTVRLTEMFFWPVAELLVWGFLTRYLEQVAAPNSVSFLLGALILWEILFRSQQMVAMVVLADTWTRNLMNLFISPLRMTEFIGAACLLGILRALLTATILAVMAWWLCDFSLQPIVLWLPFFVTMLIASGWAIGMFTVGLLLRYGEAAEWLAWAVPFLIQPFTAVFYPVSAMPAGLRAVAWLLPSTYIFSGLRTLMQGGTVAGEVVYMSLLLTAIYFALGAAFLARMLNVVRDRGLFTRPGQY